MKTNRSENKSNEPAQSPFSQTFFHGTKANLKIGDFIEVGLNSNFGQNKKASGAQRVDMLDYNYKETGNKKRPY